MSPPATYTNLLTDPPRRPQSPRSVPFPRTLRGFVLRDAARAVRVGLTDLTMPGGSRSIAPRTAAHLATRRFTD